MAASVFVMDRARSPSDLNLRRFTTLATILSSLMLLLSCTLKGWPGQGARSICCRPGPPKHDMWSVMLMVLRRADDTASDVSWDNEQQMVSRLRAGDEMAFIALVGQLQGSLTRVARHYVRDRETAEEVVQETWIGVLRGLDRFEERSSLKTWIFRILVNRARSRGAREVRTIAVSQLATEAPAVEPERFLEHGPATGHWASRPASWEGLPESTFLAQETLALIRQAIDLLPTNQREVITLRDIEGWSAAEVCNILEISETNQRVLLHRARSKVRAALEQKLIER